MVMKMASALARPKIHIVMIGPKSADKEPSGGGVGVGDAQC